MKTLDVTDEQYEFIQRLREEIAESVVGKYGFVREQDAVQFLIDNLGEDVDVEAAFDSGATADVAASVEAAIAGEDDPHELEAVSYDEAEDVAEEADESDEADEAGADDGSGSDSDDADADESDDDADESDDDADGVDGATEDDEGGAADDDDMLNEMMSLLETHDDKWEEGSGDGRYTVTLPDGSTEDVQTKDDVRALLFKHYR
ncbi:hypothetical protein ACFQGT_09150 [Natrialbaceae archaeon GCM10025810]|uniref:hypothetical protein n=1 Tax=Halovalidus salilacus TaxID=3075124 RepID=UPI003605E29A